MKFHIIIICIVLQLYKSILSCNDNYDMISDLQCTENAISEGMCYTQFRDDVYGIDICCCKKSQICPKEFNYEERRTEYFCNKTCCILVENTCCCKRDCRKSFLRGF